MTWARATLYLLLAVLGLVTAGLVALYQVSDVGFGVALGVVATILLGTSFMLAVAVSVRIITGGGHRAPSAPSPTASIEGRWRELPPPAPTAPLFIDQSHGSRVRLDQDSHHA